MHRYLLLILVGLLTAPLFAQQQLPANQNIYDDGATGFIYNREFTVGATLSSPRNIGLGVKFGQLKTYYLTRYYSINFSDVRHPREMRQSNDDQISPTNRVPRAFIFGKQNQFYVIRATLGERRYWSEKAKQRGVAVGYSYEIGPVLGLLKPYYLELRTEDGSPELVSERYTGDNADRFLDPSKIFGAAPWGEGLSEVTLRPGVHARIGAHFGFGAFDEFAKALEAGLQADFFFTDVPIMIESGDNPGIENSPLFLNLYITLQFGKRR